jgi:hypothetical protein
MTEAPSACPDLEEHCQASACEQVTGLEFAVTQHVMLSLVPIVEGSNLNGGRDNGAGARPTAARSKRIHSVGSSEILIGMARAVYQEDTR